MSSAVRRDPLPADELHRLLRQVEPAALLVPPRILRRVIKTHRGLGGFGLAVPHRKSYILDRDSLLKMASHAELGLAEGETLPPTVLLFPRPENPRPPDVQLVRYWRLLFHLEVHRAFDRLKAEGRLQGAALHARLERIGPIAFEEIRDVLRQENMLFTPDDPAAVYEEFAAVYLELRHFEPSRLGAYFPSLGHHSAIDVMLAQDVDAVKLFERTRPPGAPDPAETPAEPPVPSEAPPADRTTSSPDAIRLRAETLSRRGNQVRAALLLDRAVAVASPGEAATLRASAIGELDSLAARLQRALGFPVEQRDEWAACLKALLPAASAARFWSAEVRLLYDLQKACLDMERPLFAADLVEWAISFFKRPIKRPLPDQPFVLIVKHLRSALNRLSAVRMPGEARHQLGDLLRAGLHEAEQRMRHTFGPQIVESLDRVGLTPGSTAERLSRDQFVEELLDTIGRRGTVSIGDLRDAVARSRVKLPDLSGPGEFFTGDVLIRANRELAAQLDGVYRRGEIYLRWLQRLGSVFFGTAVGRLLTLYVIVPLLGSLLILKGTEELLHLGGALVERLHRPIASSDSWQGEGLFQAEEETVAESARRVTLFNVYSFLGLALFLLPTIHSPPFRHVILQGLWYVWLAVRGVLYDAPAGFFRLPFVRAVLQSKGYLLFWHYVGKPLLWVLPVTALLLACRVRAPWTAGASALLYVLVSVVSNTRLGVLLEEAMADWLVRTWQLVHEDLVPGLFGFFVWASKAVLDRIERFMYAVDEQLRFRQGQSQIAFVVKLVLGLVWFVLTYLFRLLYNVFVEPQINPIKHFPVVTVAHKLTLPLIPVATGALESQLGMRRDLALFTAGWLQALSPGMWGFLAWELKENWRLYRANQAADLEPAIVGGHGERIVNYIRPGFHSGTLPRLYAKLRRATGKKRRQAEEGLHHVEEEVRHFVERELLAPLAASKGWSGKASVTAIRLATNQIRIRLDCPDAAAEGCWLEFTHRGGKLVAALAEPGWVGRLDQAHHDVFAAALTGFYKRAGVDLVAEQLATLLPAGAEYEVRDGKLVVTTPDIGERVTHDLEKPDEAISFRSRKVAWQAWVEHWQREAAGETRLPPLLPEMRMLPGEGS